MKPFFNCWWKFLSYGKPLKYINNFDFERSPGHRERPFQRHLTPIRLRAFLSHENTWTNQGLFPVPENAFHWAVVVLSKWIKIAFYFFPENIPILIFNEFLPKCVDLIKRTRFSFFFISRSEWYSVKYCNIRMLIISGSLQNSEIWHLQAWSVQFDSRVQNQTD